MEDNSYQILTIGEVLLRVNYQSKAVPLHFSTECQSKAEVMQTYLEATTKLKKNRLMNFVKEGPQKLQSL
ncbi:hypothetical protein BHE74_00022531 [Ensete ventricosum]|nr:hypothetical protein BHE74_00022531 [Ensete ventricosum]